MVTAVHAPQLLPSFDSVIVPTLLIFSSAQMLNHLVPTSPATGVYEMVKPLVCPPAERGPAVFVDTFVAPVPMESFAFLKRLVKELPVPALPVFLISILNGVATPTVAVVGVTVLTTAG